MGHQLFDRGRAEEGNQKTLTEHVLKTWPQYFDAVKRGDKTFEVRRNDRGFQKGDVLVLQRLRGDQPTEAELSTPLQELRFRIGYVLTGGQFGIADGFCVLSLLPEQDVRQSG